MPVRRPLPGEPLALDLVNTAWNGASGPRDLLGEPETIGALLEEWGFAGAGANPAMVACLVETRSALREALGEGGPARFDRLNAVLARGRLRLRMGLEGPEEILEVVDPDWKLAWLAARNYLELSESRPGRIRACDGAACVLYFLDTTKNGQRRWCRMDGCGNRAKARRHRHQADPGADGGSGRGQ